MYGAAVPVVVPVCTLTHSAVSCAQSRYTGTQQRGMQCIPQLAGRMVSLPCGFRAATQVGQPAMLPAHHHANVVPTGGQAGGQARCGTHRSMPACWQGWPGWYPDPTHLPNLRPARQCHSSSCCCICVQLCVVGAAARPLAIVMHGPPPHKQRFVRDLFVSRSRSLGA